MRKRKLTIRNFENTLVGLSGNIALCANDEDRYLLFSFIYPDVKEQLDNLEEKLREIDMYLVVEDSINLSEEMARSERYEESSLVILDVVGQLMQASGTWDKLEKRYSKRKAE